MKMVDETAVFATIVMRGVKNPQKEVNMNPNYVSDVVDIASIKRLYLNLIEAPTGTGKTIFA